MGTGDLFIKVHNELEASKKSSIRTMNQASHVTSPLLQKKRELDSKPSLAPFLINESIALQECNLPLSQLEQRVIALEGDQKYIKINKRIQDIQKERAINEMMNQEKLEQAQRNYELKRKLTLKQMFR